jgi:16S rRNA (guanine966-N2)-methyltransferase
MRVISGALKGRRFNPPNNLPTRPTTDFAKTGLFNILNNNFDFTEVSFLDLFAGTGNLGYEFASRGSQRVVCVDQDEGCIRFIKKMKTEWKLDSISIVRSDVFRFISTAHEKFDLIFAGPPYALENITEIPDLIFNKELLKEDGWFIMETFKDYKFNSHPKFMQVRNYGTTHFWFFGNVITKTT